MYTNRLIGTIAKFELATGAGVLVTGVAGFCILTITLLIQRPDRFLELFLPSTIFVITPALLTAFGVYLHVIKQNKTGFILVLIGSGFITLNSGMLLITGAIFYSTNLPAILIAIVKLLLAAACLIFASIQTLKTYSQSNPLP